MRVVGIVDAVFGAGGESVVPVNERQQSICALLWLTFIVAGPLATLGR